MPDEVKRETKNLSLENILESAEVGLVVPPLTTTSIPLLGIHLLQASCREAGINARVFYSNLFYSNQIGAKLHKVLCSDYHLLLGERIFAAAAFDLPPVAISRGMNKFLDPGWVADHIWQIKAHNPASEFPPPVVSFKEWLGSVDPEHLVSLTVDWLKALAREIVNTGFRIVGCSNTLGGLVPAIAVLNFIKKADPRVITVLGGALCEAEMAEGILSLNTNIDYIFSGEGEITFPVFVKQVLDNRLPGEKIILGQDMINLDDIPLPDYHDYIEQKAKFQPQRWSGNKALELPFETSRGCWYGKCFFCGLNGDRNLYRTRSPDNIINNLKELIKRHGTSVVTMTDNMMPFQYFDTVIPRLAAEIPSINIFYQMRADLTLEQVTALKRAGIAHIQIGIESLSPQLLRLMNKLYTVRKNITMLRYARSAGIDLEWAILFGFPGDQTDEYEEMLHLLPLIRHLEPPREMVPLVLFRFSQYQRSPGSFGILDLRPAEVFKDILPSYADLDKISYYFTARFSSQCSENPHIITALWEEYRAWCRAWTAYKIIPLETLLPSLHVIRKAHDEYVLEDTRGLPHQPKRREINRRQASLLLVARPREAVTEAEIEWAVEAGLAVIIESWLIPLATAGLTLLQEFEREYERDAFM